MSAPLFQGPPQGFPGQPGAQQNPFAQLLAQSQQQAPDFSNPPQTGPPPMSPSFGMDPGQGAAPWDDPNRFHEAHPLGSADILPPGGPAAHPGFLDFMHQQDPHDQAMAAAIAVLGVRDPETAVKWAMQFKQVRDQRAFQAQQNELTRQNQQELVKQRSAYEKAQGDEKKFATRAIKLDAAIRLAGVDPTEMLSQIGPPSPDNINEWEAYSQAQTSKKKATDDASKQLTSDINNKAKIAASAAKGAILGSDYSNPKSPKFDKDFTENQLPALAAEHRAYVANRTDLTKAKTERERYLAKISKKTADGKVNSNTPGMRRNLSEFGHLQSDVTKLQDKLLTAKATAAAYSTLPDDHPLKIEANNTVEQYQQSLDDTKTRLEENQSEFEDMSGASSSPPTEPVAQPKSKGLTPDFIKSLKDKQAAGGANGPPVQ